MARNPARAIAVILVAFAASRAGAQETHDTKLHDVGADNTAWFLDPARKIRFCIEMPPDRESLRKAVRFQLLYGFSKWRGYLTDHAGTRLEPGEPRFSLEIEDLGRCDGSEDLKVYFGRGHAEVEPLLPNFHAPWGFVHRTHYDEQAGWSRGFMWVADLRDAKGESQYFMPWDGGAVPWGPVALFTHEWGHIFGCDHVRGTVLDEELPRFVSTGKVLSVFNYNSERSIGNIVRCERCAISGEHSDYEKFANNRELIKRLAGV